MRNDLIPMTQLLKDSLEKGARALEMKADEIPGMIEKYMTDKELTTPDSIVLILTRQGEESRQACDVIRGVLKRHVSPKQEDPSGQHSGARL